MFVIKEDKSIYLTRGDVAFFSIAVKTDTGEAYKFQVGDVVRFKVTEKKACENVVLSKDFGIEVETEEVEIYLEEKDTKIGEVISKPVDYWYEVELNPFSDPQTLIGYDEDGAKIFKLFPEGNEAEDDSPVTPEDIPVVDEELSLTSARPVQNQAIARAMLNIKEENAAEMKRHGEYIEGKLEKVNEFEAQFEALGVEVEEKLAKLDEFATELERFDEIEEKLLDVDENAEKLKGLEVVDITNSFATMLNGAQILSGGVYKQGDVIHGSLKISAVFSAEPSIFTVNEAYRPRSFAFCVGKLVPEGEEAELGNADDGTTIPAAMFCINNETGVCSRVYPFGENSTLGYINFTYVCV